MFFFFKQKTAYEMRISDWSSDVCSSDLPSRCAVQSIALPPSRNRPPARSVRYRRRSLPPPFPAASVRAAPHCRSAAARPLSGVRRSSDIPPAPRPRAVPPARHSVPTRNVRRRSEEHTSELQSLMRISYAVFCLKKKQQVDKDTTI